jgi:hypothetical protein
VELRWRLFPALTVLPTVVARYIFAPALSAWFAATGDSGECCCDVCACEQGIRPSSSFTQRWLLSVLWVEGRSIALEKYVHGRAGQGAMLTLIKYAFREWPSAQQRLPVLAFSQHSHGHQIERGFERISSAKSVT